MDAQPTTNHNLVATGCSASGRLVAFATVVRNETGWSLYRPGSILLHLQAEYPQGPRDLLVAAHQFVFEQKIQSIGFCRMQTGDPDDEARIQALLAVVPGLETQPFDVNTVLQWSAREKPAAPENVVRSQQHPVQLCAIELAQLRTYSPALIEVA